MEQKIISNSDQIDTTKRKIPFIITLFSFLIFMPLGFLLMWFDKTYHRYLRIFLLIFGIILISLSGYFLITISKLSGLYSDFNVQQPTMFPYTILFFLVSLGVIQIVVGFFFKRLPDFKIIFASILLILSSLAFYVWLSFLVLSVVIPLYNLSKSGNSPTVSKNIQWKTYIKPRFSFKYPGDYFTIQDDPVYSFTLATSAPQGGDTVYFMGENDVWLDVNIDASAQMLNNNTWTIAKSLDQFIGYRYENFQKKSVIIDGISGYKITHIGQFYPVVKSGKQIYSTDGIFIKDGKVYTISLSSLNKNLSESKQMMFDKILSSFKVLPNLTYKLPFKEYTVVLDRITSSNIKGFWEIPIKNINFDIDPKNPQYDLLRGAYLFYVEPQNTFYDIQPGGFSTLSLISEKDLKNKIINEKSDFSEEKCEISDFPLGLITARAVRCTHTYINSENTQQKDISFTKNCYLPLNNGQYLAYEQKVKPMGDVDLCDALAKTGIQNAVIENAGR